MIYRLSRRSVLQLGLATAATLRLPAPAQASEGTPALALPFAGINLAGAEFGTNVPGQHEVDYMYPTAAHVTRFAELGFNCFRLPFRWERLQPALLGDFDLDECGRLTGLVREITSRGLFAIIDPHNYAKRRLEADGWSQEHVIGSAEVPSEAFTDFWKRLCALFAADDHVMLGLMNEPFDLTAPAWLAIANQAIAAIRDQGARNLLLVPGTAYSGAHSWLQSGNGAMSGIVDPLEHFAIEVHQYFDDNSSGTSPEAVSGSCGSERLRDFQTWARQRGLKAFLGEFGAANNVVSLNALADICQEMSANPDVWLGWTAWAAGPFWPTDYIFNLDPGEDGQIRDQTKMLAGYANPSSADFWVRSGAEIDLDLARERWHGCESFTDALLFSNPRSTRASQPGLIKVQGSLQSLMQRSAFSLIVEVEGIDQTTEPIMLIGSDLGTLLLCNSEGALLAPFAPNLKTEPLGVDSWRQRRRCALSVDRLRSRVAIGVTGARSVDREGFVPRPGTIAVSAGSGRGRLVRITGYDHFLEPGAIDALLA